MVTGKFTNKDIMFGICNKLINTNRLDNIILEREDASLNSKELRRKRLYGKILNITDELNQLNADISDETLVAHLSHLANSWPGEQVEAEFAEVN